ncbi:complement C3 [Hyla sarda]|uniref:complement C3 n=1 Tax=Hyla sarda TaxID=327740 RepID=UPI0024C35EEA|nr:complement C3 [Hyla sarda]
MYKRLEIPPSLELIKGTVYFVRPSDDIKPHCPGETTEHPGDTMGCRLLCLTLLALLAGCFGQPCTLITPNVLRLESEEIIIVDGHNKAFEADVEIQDFPKRSFSLSKQKISLNNGNKFLGTATVMIPSKDLAKDPKTKQYVYVTVKSPVCNMEKVVLLGYQSGYVFLQTDKTIYTPGSTVLYRIFSMDYKMSPVNKAVVIEFLTPENIIVKRDTVKTEGSSGIISLSHKLPELVSVGVWTISAKYEDSPLQNYTTNFEVKEYVLPTFEIQLIPEQKYFHVDSSEFVVDIKAKFLYGKPVYGMAFVIFGVKKDGVKKSLSNTLRRITIQDGDGVAKLKRKDLEAILNEPDILEYTLYLSVTLITDSGSEMVESELEDIHIVKSPFKVLFTKTSKYFKPGMPFDLMVYVTNPDGSPAIRIPVIAEPGGVQGITGAEGTARLTINTASNANSLKVTVKTKFPPIFDAHQATATMTANAYQSGGNYLHIGITASEVKPGDNLAINFNIRNSNAAVQNQIQHFTYVIMNKGRILKADRQPRLQGQALVTMSLPINEEFIPSFRLIAYYIVGNEIVSDSIWVDVKDSCMGTLLVTGNSERDNKAQSPGSAMRLKLQADHKAYVGLVAVDKGVYVLNSKFKMSQKKVWDSVEKSDIGCTSGSGSNNMGVFYDAGLALQSSFQISTQQRSEPQCEVRAARRRRSSAQLIEQKTTYASKYSGSVRTCCTDGMHDNPMGHSCEKRAKNILEGKECVDAFLDCCNYIERKRKEERGLKEIDTDGRSDDDDEYLPDADIVSRSEFPQSWFWKIEQMNERPDNNGISTKVLNLFLKDSITTWEVLAVSLSQNKGICVAKPYEIQVLKDFFIDLKLPYSVVRNEQVEVRAVLYNYGNDKIKVRVELTHNPEFCSLSTAKAKFRQIVDIRPQSSIAVPFILVPLSLGYHDVEVKAAVSGQFLSDGIRKKLKVVPEGVRITKNVKQVTLEPQVKGKDGIQEEKVSALDEKNIVPKTEVETFVTIQGNPIGQLVENAVDGSNLNPLIVVPRGCGEQNMITMTPSVIATIFLDATNQWERIGLNRRDEALKNIRQGYVQQLVFRKPENSYAAFKDRPASTWLTAYVAKVFALAQPLVDIETDVLCGAIKWLILQRQKPDGMFKEEAPVIHQEMVGAITGVSKDVALTAFVLISMLESEKTCTPHVNNLKISIEKGTSFLLGQFPGLKKPYDIAITSYALAIAGAIDHPEKLLSAATDKVKWEEPSSRFITIEATSYALLSLLRLKVYDLTGPIVRWINDQRYYGAVYGSTQATIVMFQALAQYQMDIPALNEIDLDVSLSLPERQAPIKYRINLENALLSRSAETRLNKEFIVKAQGKGQGTLTVMSVYHALVTEKEKECKNFDLTVNVKEEHLVRNAPEGAFQTLSLEICARHLKENDATMSILDVSMMTGFAPDVDSLNKLMKGVDKYISKFEYNKEATDKGSLIIYLDKISHKEQECIKFNVHQIFKVGLIQPASVTVYDYYTPESRCAKFYHVDKDSSLLGTICQNDVCRCAEENCFLQQQLEGEIDAAERLERACAPGVDYVFKARLEEIQKNVNYDNYVMTIVSVIKEGTDENVLDKKRNFVSHIKCRKALNLKQGRDYLIWGVRGDLWDQPSGYSYIIGKDTWIEWWPNDRECQNPENRNQCDDFADLSDNLEINGCPS